MSETIWTTTVTRIGTDAGDMIDAGVLILFGEPVPPALADVSVVHDGATTPTRDLAAGDVLVIGEAEYRLEAVGELAAKNLCELGHIVLYVGAEGQKLLPGAVHARGEAIAPSAGAQVTLRGA